jgi:pimeloyl-ACP methyl ester carboxylesterase
VHWVGHSLGGLVILRFLERCAAPAGRVVFLATPALSSRAALRAARLPALATLMGPCIAEELLTEHQRSWTHEQPLGIIAGSRALGLGRLFAAFTEANDGTVAVSETRLPGATEHLVLPVSHMGILVSRAVARATGAFLRYGSFAPASATAAIPSALPSSRARSS